MCGEIDELEQWVEERMRPFERELQQWGSIPRVSRIGSWSLVADRGSADGTVSLGGASGLLG
jgi:hypothetical protein